uniref:Uncharacterized protein n=1 Tax=viral metagenome TaxID=1070528 RepID=A0A6M3XNV8_9ZZZZ
MADGKKLEKEEVIDGKVMPTIPKEKVVDGKVMPTIPKEKVVGGKVIPETPKDSIESLLAGLDALTARIKSISGLSVKQQKELITKANQATKEAIVPYARATNDAKQYIKRLQKPSTTKEEDGPICSMVMAVKDAVTGFTPSIPWGILVEYFGADSTGKKSFTLTSVKVQSVDSEGVNGTYQITIPMVIGAFVPSKRASK